MREYEKALQEYNRTLELNKDFSTAEFQIAVTYFCLDSLEIAKNRFEKLQQIYPDKKSIYKWLGFLYGYFGENEKMLAVFKEYYDKTRQRYRSQEILVLMLWSTAFGY